jgi:hypothetical protein
MRTTARRLAPTLLVVGLLTACGTAPSPTGLCDRYAEVKASVQQLRSAPAPTGAVEGMRTTADQMVAQVDTLSSSLDRIQAVSDGRLDQAIGQARQQLDEVRAGLVTAKYQAAETLGPQLTQARKDLQAALAPVQGLLDSQCSTG